MTNAAVTFSGGAAPSHQSGARYRLQVSQSATITDGNAIDDVIVDQTTYTAYTAPTPRVTSGGGSRRSTTPATGWLVDSASSRSTRPRASSTRPGDLPGIPGVQSTYTGDFPFKWTSQPYDVTWKLEVYKDDDTTLSPASGSLRDPSKQAAFVPSTRTPPVRPRPTAGGSCASTPPGTTTRAAGPTWAGSLSTPRPVTLLSPADRSAVSRTARCSAGALLRRAAPGDEVLRRHPQRTNSSVGRFRHRSHGVGTHSSTYPDGTYTWVVTPSTPAAT